ncbi:MAG: FAD/FMN-containing dehydrogenase/Fe-S oxidoreductase [Alteromonadaceae bacterium]|jgi:FAD/FMN-containing dehydrogenase/Fe-S oxidoreductase
MIPVVGYQSGLDDIVVNYLEKLTTSSFSGDIEQSYASRLTVATDNSIYQQMPQAVIFPRSIDDIVCLTQLAAQTPFKPITFSPRGGGTGTNGQSLTPGVVIDLSRHMRQIIEINVEERWVTVQSGVIKDQLNDFLRPYGFFFAPDLSTSNRATIGGMISTDASGQGSLVYGKTSDHILELTSVLIDGSVLNTSKQSIAHAQELANEHSIGGGIYSQVIESARDKRQQILAKFPRLNRFLTGYDLEHVFNDDLSEFDLSRIIAGSEGTLAFVSEAKLNITPLAPHKALVNIKYDSFESALRNSPFLVEASATSVETVDSNVLNLAKQDIVWYSVSEYIEAVPGKTINGLNIVEFNNEDGDNLKQQIDSLAERLDQLISSNQAGVIGYQITYDSAAIGKIYTMRKKAVGLLGNTPGNKKPLAFAEDTAVPPEHLADYIMAFRQLLDEHKLDYGMFGHVDAGVLHVRPALDMCDPQQEVLLRQISDQVVALTAKYNGLMWGEHGRGYRSEYGPAFFGDELFTELRKIKAVFDPDNRLNPGKICTPYHSDAQLVSVDDTKRGAFDRQIPIKVKDSFEVPMSCNGNGLCFNYDVQSPMCPSYKVSKDRRFSPKGRAGLMREWMRLLSEQGVDINEQETQLGKGKSSSWLTKFSNSRKSLKSASDDGQTDFSHQVFEAMDSCLACKACSSQCPVKVDVPEFRARFLNLYYDRYSRPVKDYFVATIEGLAPWMAKAPTLINASLKMPLVNTLIKQVIGYVDTPLLSKPTLKQLVKHRYEYHYDQLKPKSAEEKANTVIIVQDPFTSYYEAQLIDDLLSLVVKLGYKPILLPYKPNGKPQHVKGFLRRFSKTAANTAEFLNEVAGLGIPMVGIDASLVLCYRDEYKQILGDKRGNFEVLLVNEWLRDVKEPSANKEPLAKKEQTADDYYLFGHCTEKTALPNSQNEWVSIFKQFGLNLNIVSTGCCGMAGTYGHEAKNQQNSKGIYALSWEKPVSEIDNDKMVATGFSCRSQVARIEGHKPKHPVQVLLGRV